MNNCIYKIFIAVGLLLLSAGSFAQIIGGGGNPGANWEIMYKIQGSCHYTVYTPNAPPPNPNQIDTPWSQNTDWQLSNAIGPFMIGIIGQPGQWAVGTASGTVQVRIRWTGASRAPKYVWLKTTTGATWMGNSGSAFDGQYDPEYVLEAPPGWIGQSYGVHIKRYAYSGSPIILSFSPSATFSADVVGTNFGLGVSVHVAVTTKQANLARTDGGVVKVLDDNSIEAPTLMSWIGSKPEKKDTNGNVIEFDYGSISAGRNRQELEGTYSGEWQRKDFPDPLVPGSTYNTFDVRVKWYGDIQDPQDPSQNEFYPTDPRETTPTRYHGFMPETKTDKTWWYTLKEESGDYSQAELFCKWILHYAAEKWQDTEEEGVVEDVQVLRTYAPDELPATFTMEDVTLAAHKVTEWDVAGSKGSDFLGFELHRFHFESPLWQHYVFEDATFTYLGQWSIEVPGAAYDPEWNGTYSVKARLTGTKYYGTFELWRKDGRSQPDTQAWITPASAWHHSLVVVADYPPG